MSNILEIKNVSKSFADHRALNDVSFDIPKGSIFGLLGPNGAGKTTLIRIINQISYPDSGTVLFNGQPLSENTIQQIGYLPEERGLYKKMKVGDQCLYLAQLKGLTKKEAKSKLKHWFEKFEITDWWNKKVEDLSKGMAQKVQFITTVLHEPELLILDEPFSGFDPINTNLIKAEILALREKGTTIIFSTHNMESVEEICDSIALINRSENILNGSVKDIRKGYRNQKYSITFKGNMISFTNALWTNFELVDNEDLGDGYTKAQIKIIGDASINTLLGALIPVVEINEVKEIIPSMNEIFIEQVTLKSTSHE